MSLFPHGELRYYSFGLKAGLSNLLHNGFALGLKRTVGKISQPIHSYTRFPEYRLFDNAISKHITAVTAGTKARILDVGSPKMLGLYLASRADVEITLTDISPLNVDEYRTMWQSLSRKAKGKAIFQLQDARALKLDSSQYDVVYSMSVIEHVEGASGDSDAVREMVRVLKPGGLLLISVPCGPRYMEQNIVGVSGAVVQTGDDKPYFFQRIYDGAAFRSRVVAATTGLHLHSFSTVWRKNIWMHRAFARCGENVRGALGFLNPVLSCAANQACDGLKTNFFANYGPLHSSSDIYGDLIMTGVKTN